MRGSEPVERKAIFVSASIVKLGRKQGGLRGTVEAPKLWPMFPRLFPTRFIWRYRDFSAAT